MKKEEHYLQVAIHRLLTYARVFHFAIPNGGARNLKVAMSLKAEGVLAGASDLVLVLEKRIVFVELKNGNVGRQSEHQKSFQNEVEKRGFEYVIWRNIEDCEDFLKKINQENQELIKKIQEIIKKMKNNEKSY